MLYSDCHKCISAKRSRRGANVLVWRYLHTGTSPHLHTGTCKTEFVASLVMVIQW